MSCVASLFNVPSKQNELDDWSFSHAAHHRDINRVIFQLLKISLAEYVLDPLNVKDAETWLYQHQLMHQAQDEILGIAGLDLLDVNFDDKNEFAGWIFANATEHVQAAQVLRIG